MRIPEFTPQWPDQGLFVVCEQLPGGQKFGERSRQQAFAQRVKLRLVACQREPGKSLGSLGRAAPRGGRFKDSSKLLVGHLCRPGLAEGGQHPLPVGGLRRFELFHRRRNVEREALLLAGKTFLRATSAPSPSAGGHREQHRQQHRDMSTVHHRRPR